MLAVQCSFTRQTKGVGKGLPPEGDGLISWSWVKDHGVMEL